MKCFLFIFALFIILIVGSHIKHSGNIEKANNEVLSFIDNVKTENKPFTAYKKLESYYTDNTFNVLLPNQKRRWSLQDITHCDFWSCMELKANENLKTALIDSLKKSLDQNSVDAYSYLYGRDILDVFNRNMNITRNILDLQNNYVQKFISLINETTINEYNVDFFVSAGSLYGAGYYITQDSQKSNTFYEEAYKMGNQNVPSFISRNYFNLGDYQNSYLWNLRCTNSCMFNVSEEYLIKNSVYIDKLTSEQIKNIQEIAHKKEILKI